MQLKINLCLDSAAFDAEPMTEVARILREYANHLEDQGAPVKPLRDINGNTVGNARVHHD